MIHSKTDKPLSKKTQNQAHASSFAERPSVIQRQQDATASGSIPWEGNLQQRTASHTPTGAPPLSTREAIAQAKETTLPQTAPSQPAIQAKLTVGQPNDPYEQEADRVASQVTTQINAPATAVQRHAEAETELQTKLAISGLQRQGTTAGGDVSPEIETSINRARGGGQALDNHLQRSMGQAMGADFSRVRVHTDAQSDQLNQTVQAKAFTTGQDIFFRQGAYTPGSRSGQELIAHELTHVVQQNSDTVRRSPLPTFPKTPSSLIQRAPSDFAGIAAGYKERGLTAGGIGGFTFGGMSPWHKILTALDAYAVLNPDDYSARRAQLTQLQENIAEWQQAFLERERNGKKKDNDDAKSAALLLLLAQRIAPETNEIQAAQTGGLDTDQNPAVSDNPAITKSANEGVLMAGTPVYLDKELAQVRETAPVDTLCVIMMETKTAYQIQYADTSQYLDQSILNPQIVYQVRWAAKAQVQKTATKVVSQPRTDARFVSKAAQPLFSRKPTKEDVQQGGLGDCYLLAALLSVVTQNPDFIQQMMKDNSDGTVTVRLYDVDSTGPAKVFAEKFVKVNKSVVQSTVTGRDEFAQGALWVQLLEKAYVAAGYVGGSDTVKVGNSFGDIEGGFSSIAWEHLLGKPATRTDIEKQADSPVPGDTSPWGQTEKDTHLAAQAPDVDKAEAYKALVSYTILGGQLDLIDTWMLFVNGNDIETDVRARAKKGHGTYKAEIRLEDFLAYFNAKALNPMIAQAVVVWLESKKYYPGKRGTGKYTTSQLNLFQQIRATLSDGRYVALGSDEAIARASTDFGHSAGEPVAKGLAGRHAYAVLDVRPDKQSDELAPNEVVQVLIRNPWSQYGRTYRNSGGKVKAEAGPAAESWLDLSDVTKRFNAIYTTDAAPVEPIVDPGAFVALHPQMNEEDSDKIWNDSL